MQYGIIYTLVMASVGYLEGVDVKSMIKQAFTFVFGSGNASDIHTTFAFIPSSEYFIYFGLLVIVLYVISKIVKVYSAMPTIQTKEYYTIEMHTHEAVAEVIEYINMFPDIFGAHFDSTKGNTDIEFYFQKQYEKANDRGGVNKSDLQFLEKFRDLFIPKFNHKLPFDIKDIAISGNIWISNNTKSYTVTTPFRKVDDNDKKETVKEEKTAFLISVHIEIFSNKNKISNEAIKNYFSNQTYNRKKTSNKIVLIHQKSYLDKGSQEVYEERFYDGDKKPVETLEKIWIDPFFHPEKDRLWGLIKTIHTSPQKVLDLGQSPRANFLFHGPPGTGKSSFPFRVAMTLQYDICSLDLRHFASKIRLEEIIRNCSDMSKLRSNYTRKIIVFDEFDIGINHLHRIEEADNMERTHLEKQIECAYEKLNSFDIDYTGYIDQEIKNASDKKVKVTQKKKDENEEYETDENEDTIKPSKGGKGAKGPKGPNGISPPRSPNDAYGSYINYGGIGYEYSEGYSGHGAYTGSGSGNTRHASVYETTQMLKFASDKTRSLAMQESNIRLKDLLTILQGPVPKSGCFIFATTNNFDEINKLCPALFRHSRMTPIHFGYLDRKTIEDIYQYYFKRKPTRFVPEQTRNSSAEIIQYAMECVCIEWMTDDQKFKMFDDLVNKNIVQA